MMVKLQLHSLISIVIAGIVLVAPTVGYSSVGEIGKIRGSGVLERDGNVVDGITGVGVIVLARRCRKLHQLSAVGCESMHQGL